MEYKVSCNNDKDCWFIMVNIDDSDVKVPMSSSTWKTLSEKMWDNENNENVFLKMKKLET